MKEIDSVVQIACRFLHRDFRFRYQNSFILISQLNLKHSIYKHKDEKLHLPIWQRAILDENIDDNVKLMTPSES